MLKHKIRFSTKQYTAKVILEKDGFSIYKESKPYHLVMKKEYILNSEPINILVVIPKDILPTYPAFHIQDLGLFLKYPHIERSIDGEHCKLCLVEDRNKRLFPTLEGLIKDMIDRLHEFIKKLNEGTFTVEELYNEFDSYWVNSLIPVYYDIDTFPESLNLKKLRLYRTKKDKDDKKIFFEDNKNSISTFLRKTDEVIEKEECIYLNLEKYFPDIPPQTYKEFADVIQKNKLDLKIKSYMKNMNQDFIILFSFILPSNDRHFAALQIKSENLKLYDILYGDNAEDKKFEHLMAKNIQSKRVFSRGGDVKNIAALNMNKKVAIIGCGSVGASLAYKLLKSGITNLILIDNGCLEIENVARHLLGTNNINEMKAVVLKDMLDKQFIDSSIESYTGSCEKHIAELKKCDLIVIALGSDSTEMQQSLVLDSLNNKLPPIISCWLEANAVAGHSLYIDKWLGYDYLTEPFNLLAIFDNLSIVKNEYAKELLKDDVGCNSTYMPYTFINADYHINHFANMVISCILNTNSSRVWSSYGELSDIPSEHLKEHMNASFTLVKKDLS